MTQPYDGQEPPATGKRVGPTPEGGPDAPGSPQSDAAPEGGSMDPKAAQRAYSLFLRGADLENIADQLGVPVAEVTAVVAERGARGSVPADTLRILKRHLFTHMDEADVRDKPKYASALAAIESKLVQFDGRCGARKRDGSGYCQEHPLTGRTRCRLHGGRTPAGAESPHFVHGARSKYPIELSEQEQVTYEQYLRTAYDGSHEVAIARILRDRAIALGENPIPHEKAVDSALKTHTAITKGMTVRVVPDEAAIARFTDVLMMTVEKHVRAMLEEAAAKRLLALIAIDMRSTDWSSVVPPEPVAIPASAGATA